MNSEQLKRLMRLSQRTGTPLIVSEGDDAMVILDVDHYEALLGLAEEAAGYMESPIDDEPEDPALEVMPPVQEMSSPEQHSVQDEHISNDSIQHPAAPIEVSEETGLPNVTSALDEDPFAGEEEQFYLEPID